MWLIGDVVLLSTNVSVMESPPGDNKGIDERDVMASLGEVVLHVDKKGKKAPAANRGPEMKSRSPTISHTR